MPTPKKRYLDSTPAITKQQLAKTNKHSKSGIPVTYFTQSDAMPLLADNPNRTVVLDEVTVRPYKKLPMQSKLFQGITNQAANEKADEHVNRVTPTAEDLLNIGTLGGLNNLSPTQWARRAYDLRKAIKGNMSWDKFGNNWFYGNNGLVSDKYAQKHPYTSAAINLAGDIGAVGTLSALRKLPKYAMLMKAENRAAQEATALNWRDMFSNSVKRTRLGDIEIDNPGLYYHQSDAGKAKNFVSTGRMRTPLEEYWLAKEEAGEKIPIRLKTGVEPGYPQDPGSAMFAQGKLWYDYDTLKGITVNPKKPDLLVTAKEMPIANKNAHIMSDKASLEALYEQGARRVTNDNIYTQGPHTLQNTSAYTWEPEYGYRRVFAEETPTLNWADATRTPRITLKNAAKITPEQWTAAQDAENTLSGLLPNAKPLVAEENPWITTANANDVLAHPSTGRRFQLYKDVYEKEIPKEVKQIYRNAVLPRLQKAHSDYLPLQELTRESVEKALSKDYTVYPERVFKDAGKNNTAGLAFPDGHIAIKEGYEDYAVGHEVRHRLQYSSAPQSMKELKLLDDAYDANFVNLGREYPEFEGLNLDIEKETLNYDARRSLVGDDVLKKFDIDTQNAIIDDMSDIDIFDAVEEADGYGRAYIDFLRKNNLLTHKKAQQFREAMKHVGAYAAPVGVTIGTSAATLYNKSK